MKNVIDITGILVDRKNINGLNKNEQEIVKQVGLANHCARSAAQWPQGRGNYIRHCRDHLEKALIHLNEEIEGEQDGS